MLWAARPHCSLSGSLGRAPPCPRVQTCPDSLCHTPSQTQRACVLARTNSSSPPGLTSAPPFPALPTSSLCVCVCVCTRMLACSQMCSSSACRMLCCLLISLGFAQTHMHSLIICCVSSLHGCTQTHTYTPSFCPSACLLMFNVSPIHTQL